MPTKPPRHSADLRARPAYVAPAPAPRADTPEQREADRRRSSARWQRLRRIVLTREPTCRLCRAEGRTELATQVDHIEPIQRRPELAFVEANLQPLCRACHDAKSARERRSS